MAKLEIGNQSSMHELISNVEARAEIDLHGAIALLKQTSLSPAFLPWGSFALIKLLRRAGLKDEWRSYCTSLFVSHPEFFTVWQHRLDCCLSVAEYLGVATQIFFQIKTDLPQVPWLRPTLIETLLAVGQGDLEYFLQGATSAGVIERRLVDRIFALMPILVEIRLADQAVSKGARAWRYSFCGRDCPVLVRVDDLVHVNLSHLRLGGIDQGEKVLAPVFHRVCHRLLNEIPYDDDTGLGSFPKITSEDLGSLYFWLLLKAWARGGDGYCTTVAPEMQVEPGQLWVRIGNVEAWALSSYLADKEACLDAADTAAQILGSAVGDVNKIVPESDWWPRTNSVENILRLSTNAGWYGDPKSGRVAFGDWAERYLGALRDGNAISTYNEEMLKLAVRSSELSKIQPARWSEKSFFEAIDGRSLLLVTPFAAQISSQFLTGAVNRIWAAQGITVRLRSLETIESPMSVWPYRPDRDWSESFSRLEEQCLRALEKCGADLFIASCGCYGLPLVGSINRSTDITSIYFGHAVNMYFGIRTQAFLDSPFLHTADPELFVSGDLGARYHHIERIDAGRYKST